MDIFCGTVIPVKNYKKITAFLLCVLMILSLCACVPKGATINKEWGFRANGKEYSVGSYLLPLADAYESVYSYLAQTDKNFNPDKSILGTESSFDETGKIYSAEEWILKQAKEYMYYMVAVDSLMEKYDVKLQEGREDTVLEQARCDWFLGKDYQNVIDGYSNPYPLKDKYEPLGISVDSYCDAAYMLDVKYDAIFTRLYSKGGEKEVPQEELNSFFEEHYVDYSYFMVRLYDTTIDEVKAENVTVPFSAAKKTAVLDHLNTYPTMAKMGSDFSEIKKVYKEYFNITNDSFTVDRTEKKADVAYSISEDVAKVIDEMGESEAKIIVLDQSDSPVAMVVYKSPIKNASKEYFSDDINYRAMVADLKGQEFFDFLSDYADNIEVEINWDVLNSFSLKFIEKNYKSYIKQFEY